MGINLTIEVCGEKNWISIRNGRREKSRVRREFAHRREANLVGRVTAMRTYPAVVVVMVYEEVCVQQCLRTSWQIAMDELVPSSSTPSLLIPPSAGDCSHITLSQPCLSVVSLAPLFSLSACSLWPNLSKQKEVFEDSAGWRERVLCRIYCINYFDSWEKSLYLNNLKER